MGKEYTFDEFDKEKPVWYLRPVKWIAPKSFACEFSDPYNSIYAIAHDVITLAYNGIFIYGLYKLIF